MTEKKDDYQVIWSPEVEAQAAADPKKAAALRELGAIFRQAMAGVESGQYKSFEDGVEALSGSRPQPITDADDDE